MVVLEVTKAETAHSETSTATQVLPRDGTATALAAEDLATNSAMVAASQSCELARAVVALHRDVVGHPVLPALLGLAPRGEDGGELVQHHLRAARLHPAHLGGLSQRQCAFLKILIVTILIFYKLIMPLSKQLEQIRDTVVWQCSMTMAIRSGWQAILSFEWQLVRIQHPSIRWNMF